MKLLKRSRDFLLWMASSEVLPEGAEDLGENRSNVRSEHSIANYFRWLLSKETLLKPAMLSASPRKSFLRWVFGFETLDRIVEGKGEVRDHRQGFLEYFLSSEDLDLSEERRKSGQGFLSWFFASENLETTMYCEKERR